MPVYVGLDVHKKTCHATVIDEHGKIVEQRRFVNQRDEYEYFFKHIKDAKVAWKLATATSQGTSCSKGWGSK
jgi:predicted NBD/HSP70 family sugar kinase